MHTISAYIIGVCVAVALLIVSSIVSNCIAFRPDNSDCKSRKLWFWVFGVLSPVLTFVIALVLVYMGIKAKAKADSYMIAMAISSIVSFVLYTLCGFALSKMNKHGKLGNWF